jgi:hypothetical protein
MSKRDLAACQNRVVYETSHTAFQCGGIGLEAKLRLLPRSAVIGTNPAQILVCFGWAPINLLIGTDQHSRVFASRREVKDYGIWL